MKEVITPLRHPTVREEMKEAWKDFDPAQLSKSALISIGMAAIALAAFLSQNLIKDAFDNPAPAKFQRAPAEAPPLPIK